jgi:hypothetical protein
VTTVVSSIPVNAGGAPLHDPLTVRDTTNAVGIQHHATNAALEGQASPVPEATVTTTARVVGLANFQVGYDYTQNSHLPSDAGGNTAAVASAKRLLTSMGTFQNVALMGWGSGDPEPRPGVFSWGSLDSGVAVMGQTVPAGQRMISLASAPGWMKVGGSSQEWNLNAAVDPSHFHDFASLAADVAERYDGAHTGTNGKLLPKVDYFDVWNEMKGFWNGQDNTWDYKSYTEMYNDVYRAIKAVRPDALIGGPYAPVGAGTSAATADHSSIQGGFGVVDQRSLDVIAYWLKHKAGAQFLSMAGGPAATSESGFASGQYFVAVADWIRSLNSQAYPGASTLPLMWAEFYPGLDSTTGFASGQEAVAIDMSSAIQAGVAGINHLLLWEMEGNADGSSLTTGEGVWTDTAEPRGGRPTAFYTALSDLHRYFPPGTPLYDAIATGPVSALATAHDVLLINQSNGPLTVRVNRTRDQLAPYGVSVVPSNQGTS